MDTVQTSQKYVSVVCQLSHTYLFLISIVDYATQMSVGYCIGVAVIWKKKCISQLTQVSVKMLNAMFGDKIERCRFINRFFI